MTFLEAQKQVREALADCAEVAACSEIEGEDNCEGCKARRALAALNAADPSEDPVLVEAVAMYLWDGPDIGPRARIWGERSEKFHEMYRRQARELLAELGTLLRHQEGG